MRPVVTLLSVLVVLSVQVGAPVAEVLFSEGFESGLSQWTNTFTLTTTSAQAHSGFRSATFTGTTTGSSAPHTVTFAVVPGEVHVLQVAYRTEGAGGYIGIDKFDSSMNAIGEQWLIGDGADASAPGTWDCNTTSCPPTSLNTWKVYSQTFAMPAGVSFIDIKIEDFAGGLPNGPRVYIDDITLSGGFAAPPDIWNPVSLPTQGDYVVTDIWAWDASNVFVTGIEGGVRAVVYRFDGLQWSRSYEGPGPGSSGLYAIWGSSPKNVVAVGPDTRIVRFDGQTWTEETAPVGTVNLRGVHGTAPDNVFAVGDRTVLRYNGANWSVFRSSGSNFEDVWLTPTGCIITVSSNTPRVEYYNGSWGVVPAPVGESGAFTGVWGRGCDDFHVVGHNGSSGSGIFYDCNQEGCQPTTCSVPQTWTVRGIGDHVFSVGLDGSARHLTGPLCTPLPVGTSMFLYGVWAVSRCSVYVGGIGSFIHGTCSACPDVDGDSFSECTGDCNDADPAVYPGATEVCNGVDDDCNHLIDDLQRPGRVEVLQVRGRQPDVWVSWSPIVEASAYDVVRGTLNSLVTSGGDYGPSVDGCLGSDISETSIQDGALPPAGDGFWYLVRAENLCMHGSYDEASPSQVGSRDWGIAASPHACP